LWKRLAKILFSHEYGALLDENVDCRHVAENVVHHDEEKCTDSDQDGKKQ